MRNRRQIVLEGIVKLASEWNELDRSRSGETTSKVADWPFQDQIKFVDQYLSDYVSVLESWCIMERTDKSDNLWRQELGRQ